MMNEKLDSLIQRIRQEGVDEAQRTSDTMLAEAEEQARRIGQEARLESERILEAAKQEAADLREKGEQALRQASRDTVLLLRERIVALFESALQKEIAESLDPGLLVKLLESVVGQWRPDAEIEVLVSETDSEALAGLTRSRLKQMLTTPISIVPSSRVTKGFRIGTKGGDVYYEFTDEALLESLKSVLAPRLRAILDGSRG